MSYTSGFVYVVVTGSRSEPSELDEIVVPLDGSSSSERAVPIAADLANRLGAGLRLLTTEADVGDLSPTAYLESIAAHVAGGVAVKTEVALDAEPAATILDATHPGRVGVCMATHARGRILSALHTSVTETVVARRRGPIVLVGPACRATELRDGPALVGVDGTSDAMSRVTAAIPLLAALTGSLILVSVAQAPSGKATDDPFHQLKQAMQPLLDEAIGQGMEASHRLAFATDVRHGLLDEIETLQPSLVVIAAHHHELLQRLRDGTTTASIAHSSAVPVLVV